MKIQIKKIEWFTNDIKPEFAYVHYCRGSAAILLGWFGVKFNWREAPKL